MDDVLLLITLLGGVVLSFGLAVASFFPIGQHIHHRSIFISLALLPIVIVLILVIDTQTEFGHRFELFTGGYDNELAILIGSLLVLSLCLALVVFTAKLRQPWTHEISAHRCSGNKLLEIN